MSYAVHYDLSGRGQDGILQDFSRMRIEAAREPPVLYVAMATWIPKCNMYHHNCEPKSPTEKPEITVAPDVDNNLETNDEDKPTTSKQLEQRLSITPKKAMSPKQLQKKLESEKKRQQKQLEREEREKEKERLRQEKQKEKQLKEEQKRKEKEEKEEQKRKEKEEKEEQKRKEREEKEAKRKEREEREELKRKEREQEKLRKQQEMEEKNKEKQKLEEQKQKAAAAFVNFFVPKKPETKMEEGKSSKFMPFEVKSDMRLAPSRRRAGMSEHEKEKLADYLERPDEEASYLSELKGGKQIGKYPETWPYEDDVVVVEEDIGESICEDKSKSKKMRAKFLKFHENRRPPYFGTWRKKSGVINSRKPFAADRNLLDYEVDSDDDWEEEEQGESLSSDEEEKENEAENDDYEVDNEFFVPHGHLSDDEVDDEATSKLSPESHKQKLKLLKDEFDQDMQMKTHKMKPRSIGCVWYNKDGSNLIHGNVNKRTMVVDDFISYMQNNGYSVEVSKTYLRKKLKQFAQWKKCAEEGLMLNKFCWCVEDDVKKKYNLELSLK
ncbi:chromatin assembly factor 1 subunit A [Asbolus verrucosus]|uniref:Chromatin assembly factor 1 subunit A n=1 Tax=Asbolus verrucosus TaxID=1661398 RepID=A0A482WAD3_ASBVE|nr:chromatin assembly factor 1 subunit A [Asbolus verrucosus]